MKTHILSGLIIAGVLSTSAVQAATVGPAEELYSGMSASAIQNDQRANPAAEQLSMGKSTCAWHEARVEEKNPDPLYAAYPSESYHEHEKDYLSPANMDSVC